MKYNLSKKNAEGKWWSWGTRSQNQWGNYQVSFKITPEFKKMISELPEGSWLNFSEFEQKEKQTEHDKAKTNGYQPQGDEVF